MRSRFICLGNKKKALSGVILYYYISVAGTCKNADGTCFTQEFTLLPEYTCGRIQV